MGPALLFRALSAAQLVPTERFQPSLASQEKKKKALPLHRMGGANRVLDGGYLTRGATMREAPGTRLSFFVMILFYLHSARDVCIYAVHVYIAREFWCSARPPSTENQQFGWLQSTGHAPSSTEDDLALVKPLGDNGAFQKKKKGLRPF